MTPRSPVTPARWTALGLVCLVASTACSHTEPFDNPQGSEEPFDPGPPVRLTLNAAHDGKPTWLADGSGILYSAQQLDRADADVCLAELPPGGGRQRRLVCDIPGDRANTDAAQWAAASPDGRVALVSADNRRIGGPGPVFVEIALIPTLDTREAQMVRRMPFTPTGGTPQNYAGHLRWLTPETLVYVGQRLVVQPACPDRLCPIDTLEVSTEITTLAVGDSPAAAAAVPGTERATGVAPVEAGAAILYTLPADTRIYRRDLAGGDVTVVHDFGAAGVARDVHAVGTRVAAIVGGRVAFSLDPRAGPVQRDSGGVVHVVELGEAGSVALDTPGRLYRRPALSPDGARIVVEGYPVIVSGGPAPDTTVGKSGDLFLFGGE